MNRSRKEIESEIERLEEVIARQKSREQGESPYPKEDIQPGLLTPKQREHLTGEGDKDVTDRARRAIESRVRERAKAGVIDLIALDVYLTAEDRRDISAEVTSEEVELAIAFLESLKSD